MKILYLLFTFLFLAFLSEPGNAQEECLQQGGFCRLIRCPFGYDSPEQQDCRKGQRCCIRKPRK
uniref:Beta-defensin-like protein n=1 Tax=Bothrops jararaca TaxID=8724 RepID=M1KKQ5_BOTJA|nr:beta-defensin-like protein [Bothrops jararaca]